MHDWRVITALAVLLYILIAYIIEVILGSSSALYNAELGMNVTGERMKRLSTREFFFRYLPIPLGVSALLLIVAHIR